MKTNKAFLTICASAGLGLFGLIAGLNAPALPGFALAESSAASVNANLWNRTELYFGSGKPDGSSVTEKEFRAFVDKEVTPRFPDGLTLLTGYGQYRGSSGKIIKEQSFVLVLLYQGKDANAKLEVIRAAYKRAFKQESVLRVDDTTRVSF
jgi:Protein of unknown function (DUF3574)